MNHYSFSIIMPVCNDAGRLEESIGSIVGQTLDFAAHVQLILVDDGSTDASPSICREYARKYDNVVYERQPCQGASAALNRGVKIAEGDYIGFLRTGDTWDEGAFEALLRFFRSNPAVGIAVARTVCPDAGDAQGGPEGEFAATQIVNVFAQPGAPQVSGAASFFRSSLAEHLVFPPVRVGADFSVASRAILRVGVFGLVADAVYQSRERAGGPLALDDGSRSAVFDPDVFDAVFLGLFRSSKEVYGYAIPYIQHAMMRSLGDDALQIEALEVRERDIVVEGVVNAPLDIDRAHLRVRAGKKAVDGELRYRRDLAEAESVGPAVPSRVGFRFCLPRDVAYRFFFEFQCGSAKRTVGFGMGPRCRLSKTPGSYFVENDVAVVVRKANRIQVIPDPSLKERVKRELAYDKALLQAGDKPLVRLVLNRASHLLKGSGPAGAGSAGSGAPEKRAENG